MAVYSMYWDQLRRMDKLGQEYIIKRSQYVPNPDRVPVKPAKMFREVLENTPDFYCFIITVKQWDDWEDFICAEFLYEFIHYEMPYFVSNVNYPTAGRKLRLVILKGKGKSE